MSDTSRRVLLISEDPATAHRILDLPAGAPRGAIELEWEIETAAAVEKLDGGSYDAALLDLVPVRTPSRDALRLLSTHGARLPIVVLHGPEDEELGLRALRHGAQESLCRSRLTWEALQRALRHAIERFGAGSALRLADSDFRTLFENSVDGMFRSTPDGTLLTANPALAEMLGYDTIDGLLQSNLADIYAEPGGRALFVEAASEATQLRNQEILLRRRDGRTLTALENSRVVRSPAGEILYYEGTLTDITERKRYEDALAYLASHDPLTRLHNRRSFLELLSARLAAVRRYGGQGALLALDLDNFKEINDAHGHQVGDDFLTHFAGLLERRLRESDVAARLGGDEFVILLPHATREQAEFVARDLIERLGRAAPLLRGVRVHGSVSIGVALFGRERADLEDLLSRGDAALYMAKSAGRSRLCVDPEPARAQILAVN